MDSLPGRAVTACRGCGANWLEEILDLGPQPLAERDDGHRYPLALLRCAGCGLVQLSWEVPRDRVFPPDHPYATGNTKALREHFAGLAAVIAPLLRPGDLVADIGANDGTFLAAVRRAAPQARLLAVEPTDAVRACRAAGIPAEQAPWSAELAAGIRETLGPARVITASNVLAHTGDVHDFLDGVAALLRGDGTFITENHDFASVDGGLQIDTVYHEHLLYFTPATLGRLLEQHGFLAARTELAATHGGSFRTHAVRARGHLQERAEGARSDLQRLLAIASESGKIYGISAATRATPLIHFAGIESYLDRVCEVAGSARIGTVIPGTLVPVTDEKDLIADQPPHALLLCWHIADSVIPALRAAGYEGRFITPLPVPRMIYGR